MKLLIMKSKQVVEHSKWIAISCGSLAFVFCFPVYLACIVAQKFAY